ncbi:MAG: 23S rRNA (adenine(2503)-C(2))-methyltransferase RlmN [Verrucomicrobiota bacterium]
MPVLTQQTLEGLSFSRMQEILAEAGVNPTHAKALFASVQRKLSFFEDLRSGVFLPPLQRWLESEESLSASHCEEVDVIPSTDGFTHKYLLRLENGAEVESVRMGYPGRYTACLSSQVGCAMGCVFCATGQMGFSRHLSAGEIVAQAHHVQRSLRESGGGQLRNIVMMGMGEPFHNYDAVIEAMDILTDTRGLNIGPARAAISTVGHIPGILKLARHPKRYSLLVSLHGASDEERGRIMPINKRWPLADLIETCREYSAIKKAKVFVAWTLIRGVNDTLDHARRLVDLIRGMEVHVNLIPLNPTDGFSGETPDEATVYAFQKVIQEAGLPSTIRQRRGIDVAAGCGQLKVNKVKRDRK